jgi:single-strand DNA-binding protein
MNQVMLIGRSGAKAELRYTPSEVAVCNLSIATSEKKQDGTYESTWHKVVLFNKIAEKMASQIQKGSEVFVQGKLTVNEWTNKEGKKQKDVSIVAFIVRVIEKQLSGEEPGRYSEGQKERKPVREEDIPF